MTNGLPSDRAVSRRVPLGSSRVEVSQLGLGCAPIGNLYTAVSDDDAAEAIRTAWDLGIRYFDTAPQYGHGLAEMRLGSMLATLPRDEFVISTKVGRILVASTGAGSPTVFADAPPFEPVFDFSADGVERSVEESLGRLGLDRIDILLVHDPDDHLDEALHSALPRLARMRDDGRVGAIGAGMNQSAALERIVSESDVDCILVAGRYTLLEQAALDGLLPRCEQRGVSVIAAGVFNSGLLANPREGAPYDYAEAPESLVSRARLLASACEEAGTSLQSAALRFPLTHPSVACVLTGARNETEIRENVDHFREPGATAVWDHLKDRGLLDPRVPATGGPT